MLSSNGGADGFDVFRFDEVAGISSVVPSSTVPPIVVVRVVFDLRLPVAVALERPLVDSAMKQSLTCQHSHKHDPTPTNVKINDVSALITMSVLFGIGSVDVTIIGGSSLKVGGGQFAKPSLANTWEMQTSSSHFRPFVIVSQSMRKTKLSSKWNGVESELQYILTIKGSKHQFDVQCVLNVLQWTQFINKYGNFHHTASFMVIHLFQMVIR